MVVPCCLQAVRAVDAVGRAVKGGGLVCGVLDGGYAARVVVGQGLGAPAELQCVAVAVEGDEVAFGLDSRDQLGPALRLLTDHEERGPGVVGSEEIKDLGGALGMRAVVESEGDAGLCEAPRELERRGGSGIDGCEDVGDHGDVWMQMTL